MSLPTRLFSRELGRRPSTSIHATNNTNLFTDEVTNVYKTLEMFMDCQCQIVNPDSTTLNPIPIYCLERIPNSAGIIAADEVGQIHVVSGWFNLELRNFGKHPCPSTSVNICEKAIATTVKCIDEKILVGTGQGGIAVVDLSTLELLKGFSCHEKTIKKVDSFDGSVIVSCGKDNVINVHDLRVKGDLPVNIITDAHTYQSINRVGGGRSVKAIKALPGTSTNSVTDVVFMDDNHIISSGATDGRLKLWDLRVTYKHMKKIKPVTIVEYPEKSNLKGYSCLRISGSKLFASSVKTEIFQFNLGNLEHEATYKSPSKLTNFSRIDLSMDGNYLAVGTDDPKAYIFKTANSQTSKNDLIEPIKMLQLIGQNSGAESCPLFSPFNDLTVTTAGDTSIVSRWTPISYLTSSSDLYKLYRKQEIENPQPIQELKTEFTLLTHRMTKANNYLHNNQENCNDTGAKRVRFERLDSFPNYVLDGMKLPHVVPRIRIKLRNSANSAAKNWLMSPDTRNPAMPLSPTNSSSVDETTPKRRSAVRKRRKFCDDSLSPKIIQYFKTVVSPQVKKSTDKTKDC